MNGELQTEAFNVPDFSLQPLQNQYIYCPIFKGNVFSFGPLLPPRKYKMTISSTKTKAMAMWGNQIQRVKIVINDNIIEQVTDFKYPGYCLSEYKSDLEDNLYPTAFKLFFVLPVRSFSRDSPLTAL